MSSRRGAIIVLAGLLLASLAGPRAGLAAGLGGLPSGPAAMVVQGEAVRAFEPGPKSEARAWAVVESEEEETDGDGDLHVSPAIDRVRSWSEAGRVAVHPAGRTSPPHAERMRPLRC